MNEDAIVNVDIMRHGPSHYSNYLVIEDGGDPNKYVDYTNQVPDLDQSEIGFVRKRAATFARGVAEDEIVVVLSSGEMRAYQTACEIVAALEQQGKHVADLSDRFASRPYPVGINAAREAEYRDTGGIITLDQRIEPVTWASLHYKSMWAQDMLEPKEGHHNTTFNGLDVSQIPRGDRADYELARKIIRAVYGQDPSWDDASWGDNWARFHKMQPFARHIPTVEENTERMVGGLLDIMDGIYAPKETGGRRVRYIVLTHEENIIGFTAGAFGETRVKNCQRLALEVPTAHDRFMRGYFKGQSGMMAHLYVARLNA